MILDDQPPHFGQIQSPPPVTQQPPPPQQPSAKGDPENGKAGVGGESAGTAGGSPPGSDNAFGSAPGKGAGDGGSRFEVNTEEIRAERQEFAGVIHNYDNCTFGEISREVLNKGHFRVQEVDQLARDADELVLDSVLVENMATFLASRRLLLIAGDPRLGKASLAAAVADRLRRHSRGISRVLLCPRLSQDVRFSLDHLLEHELLPAHLQGSVLIFKDAFAFRNKDITAFLQELEDGSMPDWQKKLASQRFFVIVTSDLADVPRRATRLRSLEVLREISAPSRDLRQMGLYRRFEALKRRWQMEDGKEDLVYKAEKRLYAEADQLLDRLTTFPQIVWFLETCLMDAVEKEISFEEALRRAEDLEGWLFDELGEDFEAWSFVLTLVLGCAVQSSSGLPWLQFQRFRSALAKFLRREMRREIKERSPRDLTIGAATLQRLRATLHSDAARATDFVRFADESYPERLWKVLLGPGRNLLGTLVPWLVNLAEEEDPAVRILSARALGRIGEIDVGAVIRPLVTKWSSSEDRRHHVALGQLFQGVLASQNREFGWLALSQLRRSAFTRDDFWVGAIALREIGSVNRSLALRELAEAMSRFLDASLPVLTESEREDLRKTEKRWRDLPGRDMDQEASLDPWQKRALGAVTRVLFPAKAQRGFLAAVEYSLEGLCLSSDPVAVLTEWYREVLRVKKEQVHLLGLLFLRPGGIADTLERTRIPRPVKQERDLLAGVSVGLILSSAVFGDGEGYLRRFLEAIYFSTGEFPGVFNRALRARFVQLLKVWIREGSEIAEVRPVVKDLVAGLLAAEYRDLRDFVFRLLQEDPDLTTPGSTLEAFALEILTHRPRPAPPLEVCLALDEPTDGSRETSLPA